MVVSQQIAAPIKITFLEQLFKQYGEAYNMTLRTVRFDGNTEGGEGESDDVELNDLSSIKDLSQDEECMCILTLDTRLKNHEESHSMNIYIGNMTALQLSQRLGEPPSALSQVLTKTKQCFVFKINASENIEKTLAPSGKSKENNTITSARLKGPDPFALRLLLLDLLNKEKNFTWLHYRA